MVEEAVDWDNAGCELCLIHPLVQGSSFADRTEKAHFVARRDSV